MKRTFQLGTSLAVAAAISVLNQTANAQTSPEERKPFQATIKPVLIDSANQTGTALGIDYDINYVKTLGGKGKTSRGERTVSDSDADVAIREGELVARVRGTMASSKEKNPNKLIDLSAAGHYLVSTVPAWYRVGGNLTYETDQSLANKQLALGASAGASKVSIFQNGDAGSIMFILARVNPIDDTARKTAEGKLDAFQRWNLEVSYSLNINSQKLRSVDVNYRHYQEISPSTAIKNAGLDRNKLGLIRLNLDQGFFLQYSSGSLPFDQRSERAVKVGWTAKFD